MIHVHEPEPDGCQDEVYHIRMCIDLFNHLGTLNGCIPPRVIVFKHTRSYVVGQVASPYAKLPTYIGRCGRFMYILKISSGDA